MPENKKVIIVGGGPAGMMAAVYALREGADVVVLEKNEKVGKKLYITGKGRCNLTNDCEMEEMLAAFPHNARFMYSALKFFSPETLRQLLSDLGCETMVERGKRVYPVSQKASDVTKALSRGMSKAKVLLNAPVQSFIIEEERVKGVCLENGQPLRGDAVILATGGLSYPVTGSTGDGYRLAMQAGHAIAPLSPSLVPIRTREDWPKGLQGLSLKNVSLSYLYKDKKQFQDQGEMLFTHFGVSGPLALSASCHLSGRDMENSLLVIDMKPALSLETLERRLEKDCELSRGKRLDNMLCAYLPSRMAMIFPDLAMVDAGKACYQVTAKERTKLAFGLKNIQLHPSALCSYDEAVITRGGVAVKEINPSTMASKLIDGLYFAGELIDVDGYTGGFNLQIAFSTGALAGFSAARNTSEN